MESPDGNFGQLNLWKLKKKLSPKQCDPPMGKKDEKGTLMTVPKILKDLYFRTYQGRLRHREMKEEFRGPIFPKRRIMFQRDGRIKKQQNFSLAAF